MKASRPVLLSIVVVIVLAGAIVGYVAVNSGTSSTTGSTVASSSATSFVTGTSADTASDVLFSPNTTCHPSVGQAQLLVVSDSGSAVSGLSVNAVDTYPCYVLGSGQETQTIYLDNFSVGAAGWLTPVDPPYASQNGAVIAGELNFTVTYQGNEFHYHFTTEVPPVGNSCVKLHVPSGAVTISTAGSCA